MMEHPVFGNAKWITPEEKTEPDIRKGAGYLWKSFLYKKEIPENENGEKILLHATAHGLYEIRLNKRIITDARFTPGCDEYQVRLQYQTYDITEFVSEGENELTVTLGDGWYRGCNGIDGVRNLFGADLSFLCRIEAGQTTLAVTDESWQGTENGPVLLTDLELGEIYDARKEEKKDWHPARIMDFDFSNLVPTKSVPVTEHETFEGKFFTAPNGDVVFDFGQNLAGYTSLVVEDAKEGQEITLVHGETLDENGNFTIANFQPGDRNKSGGIKQEIHYVCKAGKNEFKPSFSMFGFRYAKIVTDIDLSKIKIKSIAVYSNMKQTAEFCCSDASVNRLFQNSVWSMKSNFCDIPTDCPTRERAGWTGDAGVFVKTGNYLMDCYPVYQKWLCNVRLNQHDDGKMAYISPRNGIPGKIAEMFSASVGWGDAGVIVPYTLYQFYGEREILAENYEMMKSWVNFLSERAKKSKLKHRFQKNPYRDYVIDTGMDYGEWCEPGANVMETMTAAFRNGQPEVATAYYAYSAGILAKVAGILGKEEDRKHFGELSHKAREAYRFLFVKDGHITSKRQCEYVRPIAFGLLDEEEEKNAAADLNRLVADNGYHLNTGFLSTPFLCEVLAKHGYVETAYRLLLQKEYPGWLYSVEKGATTIWETWDGIREDGTVHDSLNHYSYGAVSGWLLSGICGIQYAHDALTVAPVVHPLLEFAKGSYDSPRGRIVSEWKFSEDKKTVRYRIEIPENVTAQICLPGEKGKQVCGGTYEFEESVRQ